MRSLPKQLGWGKRALKRKRTFHSRTGRKEFYAEMVRMGIMSVNEVRKLEGHGELVE